MARQDKKSSVDLSRENPGLLEATKDRFGLEWRRHGYRSLAIAGVGFVLMVAILVGGYFLGVFETGGAIIIVVAGLGACGLFLWIFIEGLGIILSNPPLAQSTPEGTIHQYYERLMMQLLTTTGKIGQTPWVKSYVCLLEQAKSRFTDFDAFVVYWKDASKDVREQLYSTSPHGK